MFFMLHIQNVIEIRSKSCFLHQCQFSSSSIFKHKTLVHKNLYQGLSSLKLFFQSVIPALGKIKYFHLTGYCQ